MKTLYSALAAVNGGFALHNADALFTHPAWAPHGWLLIANLVGLIACVFVLRRQS